MVKPVEQAVRVDRYWDIFHKTRRRLDLRTWRDIQDAAGIGRPLGNILWEIHVQSRRQLNG